MSDDPDSTLEAVKKDLRNIIVEQEAYRADYGGYATDFLELQHATGCRVSPDNIAGVVGESAGFMAPVRSVGRQGGAKQCSVYRGTSAEAAGKVDGLTEVGS